MPADFVYFDIHYAIELHDWIIENSGGFPGSNNLSLLEVVFHSPPLKSD
jgi:death on curing protein